MSGSSAYTLALLFAVVSSKSRSGLPSEYADNLVLMAPTMGDTLDGDGGAILLLQLESEMDEVPRVFSISDIQISPIEMKGRVYAICVRSSMMY